MTLRSKQYLLNTVAASCFCGAITGVLTAVVMIAYKICSRYVIFASENGYDYLRRHLWWLPVVIVFLVVVAWLLAICYRKHPGLRGGGIPTSIGIVRGLATFRWWKNLIGTFVLSLVSFFIGLPLGNEGPSVQMGTAIGRGTVHLFPKRHRAWDRLAMTGGASAGFAVATGAPISGALFAIEEAHQRITPTIVITSVFSVAFACITSELISPLCGVSVSLFPQMRLPSLPIQHMWLPLTVGVIMGLFAVAFLKYFRLLTSFFNRMLSKVSQTVKMLSVMLLTLAAGLFSFSFISSGHDLILSLWDAAPSLYMLLAILLVRTTLTLSANTNGFTGGVFVPLLAIGAVVAAILGNILTPLAGLSDEQYTLILVLGVTACIAGMMKMPLTAIAFSVEVFSCPENILSVLMVAATSFAITEMFGVQSINEYMLEHRMKHINAAKTSKTIDAFVTVQPKSFAIGKQIRDIFWPANLFVLSVKRGPDSRAEVDEHGEKILLQGDILHVRYATFDEEQTKEELTAIVGDQLYEETKTDIR